MAADSAVYKQVGSSCSMANVSWLTLPSALSWVVSEVVGTKQPTVAHKNVLTIWIMIQITGHYDLIIFSQLDQFAVTDTSNAAIQHVVGLACFKKCILYGVFMLTSIFRQVTFLE